MLLVEPEYYTKYPPLGLLKLSSLHNDKGDQVFFHQGLKPASEVPSAIYITSLFTYAWRPVYEAIEYYRSLYPKAIITVGGIYATLMPGHVGLSKADNIHEGLFREAEFCRPDYSLVPNCKSSILFTTRGCIRSCNFCAVPRLEGSICKSLGGIQGMLNGNHKDVILWDNNILGAPNWRSILAELKDLHVKLDFNQGLDSRLITEDVASELANLKIQPIRMAYDNRRERSALQKAIPALEQAGFNRRQMIVYTLYNFTDTPDEFFERVKTLLSWGVVSYPMRYEPLNTLTKNKYVSPHWTLKQLEMVAKARRVLGAGGAFPPYTGLVNKFQAASSFEEAFSLRPRAGEQWEPKEVAGILESSSSELTRDQAEFREVSTDPVTILQEVSCCSCGRHLSVGEYAFAVQDYMGTYVDYVCPSCHPEYKLVSTIWCSVLGDDDNGRKGKEETIYLSVRSDSTTQEAGQIPSKQLGSKNSR